MVSRILEDSRYIGEKGYPALIDRSSSARQRKRGRQEPAHHRKHQHRRPCGGSAARALRAGGEARHRPAQRAHTLPRPYSASGISSGRRCLRKNAEDLTSALERQPIDEDNARALLLQLAAEQYDTIGNTEYETVRLRRLLTGRKPITEPDAELLQSVVSKVRVTNNCVTVTLKNGQVIERRDQM